MPFDLPFIWAGIIAAAVLLYVIMDGFDLGVGILFPFYKKHEDRNLLINTIAPVWDGNETWLVMGGGGLLAVFPLAYAVILPALYAPLLVMLLALIFRGVAFEFRGRTKRGLFFWDWGFHLGSLVAAFAQGITLGALVQGIDVEGRTYAGGWWDWLTPFSLLTGIALVAGYALLGATWLLMKTEHEVRAKARRLAVITFIAMLGLIGVVSLWTPFLRPEYLDRWFEGPSAFFSLIVPALIAVCGVVFIHGFRQNKDHLPFLASLGIFVLCYIGIGISFYPYIVPHSLTIWDAAAPDTSLRFLLAGTAVLLPMILAYTAYAYYVFRGKTDPEEGYH